MICKALHRCAILSLIRPTRLQRPGSGQKVVNCFIYNLGLTGSTAELN